MTNAQLTDYLIHLRDSLESAIQAARQHGASNESLSDLRVLADEIDEKIGELLGIG